MFVQEVWRYPVKSMRGERLERARVEADGIAGDRLVHVARGPRVVTSRTHPRLLGLQGGLDAAGRPLVDGQPWDSPAAAAAVHAAAGPARLVFEQSLQRFDVLPLLVATDGGIAALGEDGRRLRPNLVVGGVEGLAERTWSGRRLRIGEVVIGVDSAPALRHDHLPPGHAGAGPGCPAHIVRELGGRLALDCWVERPGEVAVGDPVELD